MNVYPAGRTWCTVAALATAVVLMPMVTTMAKETRTVPERSAIETKYKWSTETIFPDPAAWEKEYADVSALIKKVDGFKGTTGEGPESLMRVLSFRDSLEPRIERIYVYASLLSDQDTRVGETQAMKARARSMFVDYASRVSWLVPELTSIPYDKIKDWMTDNHGLALYRQYFDDLFRQKKYILSPREEELLAMAGEVRSAPGNAYNFLANADLQFPTIKDETGVEVELDDSAFYLYMRSTDRRVRKDAYQAIVGAYARYRNTAAALLNGAVQNDVFNVKARGYDSSLQAALDDSNIPVSVYTTLVNTIDEHLPLLHRYQTIRRRTLDLKDGVHAYDLFAPLITGERYDVEYEQAVATIKAALQPLGPEYMTRMTKGFDSRWVDVFPTKGKKSGAYSSGSFLTQPYILLNFHGGYEDMSTLAHEMGHSMHSYFSRGTQPYVYSDYTIFCAEVASTCNEILLQNYVLKHTEDPRKRLFLIGEFLETMRGTIFRQTMFSEFEQRIHEMAEAGQPLTADTMGAVYREIMRRYYGPDYTHDELVDNYWIRIPHFYRNFYVYKYATSYCAASNIARRIMAGEPEAVDAYLEFLKGGSSKYSVDLLKMARVDVTTPEYIRDAMKLFEELLNEAEELLKKIG